MNKQTRSFTTAADGTATVYSGYVTGELYAIGITLDATTPPTNTVDITMTLDDTGEAVLTLTNVAANAIYYPRVPVHDEAGAVATLDGTRKMRTPILLIADRIKCVVAQGGDTKTAVLTFITR
jgi:hypothetical protein